MRSSLSCSQERADAIVVSVAKSTEEGEGVPDVEEEPQQQEEEEVVNETMFTFDQFEQVRGFFMRCVGWVHSSSMLM